MGDGADDVGRRRLAVVAGVLFALLVVSGITVGAGIGVDVAAAQTENESAASNETQAEQEQEQNESGDGEGEDEDEDEGAPPSASEVFSGSLGADASSATESENETGGENESAGGGGGGGSGDGESATGYDGIADSPDASGSVAYGGGGSAEDGGSNSRTAMVMDEIFGWAGQTAGVVMNWMLENSYGRVVGTPTFEASGWLDIFGSPTVEPFATLFAELHERLLFPMTLSLLLFSGMLMASWIPFSDFIGTYSASRWMLLFFALIFALAVSMPIAAAGHEASDTIGTLIAPSVDELTGTDEGIMTLRTAAIPAAGGLYIFGWIKVIIYVLIYGLRDWLLTMVMPWVFAPSLAMSIAAPWKTLRDFGSTVLGWYAGLLMLNIPPAIMWRSAYFVGGIEASYIDQAFAQTMYMMGALVAGVVMPIAIMWKMGSLGRVARSAAVGTAAGLAARHKSGYKPKTIDRTKTAGRRARDIGRSAQKTAHTIRETISDRIGGNNGGGGGGGGSPARRTRGSGNSPWSTQAGRAQAARGGGGGTRHK